MGAAGPFMRRTEQGFAFWCPGCAIAHGVAVHRPQYNGAQWVFTGSVDRPSFAPSINIRTGRALDPAFVPEEGDPPEVCHFFVRDGRFEYLGDCTHALAGQTVNMVPFPFGSTTE